MTKIIWINIFVSVFMFGFIFYNYAGISGGDLAIISANIFFGFFQLLVNSIYARIKKFKIVNIQLIILGFQLIELLVFLKWGYIINEWLKTKVI